MIGSAYSISPLFHPQQKEHEPYLKLWAAVLFQAIADVKLTPSRRRKLGEKDWQKRKKMTWLRHYEDAKRWFESSATGVGSFIWICEKMLLHQDLVREIILNQGTNYSQQWRGIRDYWRKEDAYRGL